MMILNHERKRVYEVSDVDTVPSYCPDCNGILIAKRGKLKIWHWAHKSNNTHCGHTETNWHLAMKLAYYNFNNWEIEVPIDIKGKKFRVDTMNKDTNNIREFVHCLSPYYFDKHIALKQDGKNILWILDGEKFVSKRCKWCRNGNGYRKMLTEGAYYFHRQVGTIIHYGDNLWKEWKNNVWFPLMGDVSSEIIKRFNYEKMKLDTPDDMIVGPREMKEIEKEIAETEEEGETRKLKEIEDLKKSLSKENVERFETMKKLTNLWDDDPVMQEWFSQNKTRNPDDDYI